MTLAQAMLIVWFRKEFKRRSEAVRRGDADIEWVDERNRVTWSEIVAQARLLEINDSAVDLRLWWDDTKELK